MHGPQNVKRWSVDWAVRSYHVNTIRFILSLFIENCAHRKEKDMHTYIKYMYVNPTKTAT